MGLGGEGGWQLFAEDGLMKMYKRELEVDGLVCDPLKAVHVVKVSRSPCNIRATQTTVLRGHRRSE